MFTFILSVIVGWFIYEKFFRVNYTTGDDYLKELNTLTYHSVEVADPKFRLVPMWAAWPPSSDFNELKYHADPSDVLGIKPSDCVHKIIGKNGVYQTIYSNIRISNDFNTTCYPMQTPTTHHGEDYVKYAPKTCPICGEEVWYLGPMHPNTHSEINTSIVPSSESRYCEHCREILRRDTETFIPFFIEELNFHPTLITVNEPHFKHYMFDCKRITIMNQELERVGYSEISHGYDRLLTLSTLTEYTKNLGGLEQWELFKGLR